MMAAWLKLMKRKKVQPAEMSIEPPSGGEVVELGTCNTSQTTATIYIFISVKLEEALIPLA